MSADRLAVYRILAADIDILTTVAEHLQSGMLNRDAELRSAQALRLLIGRAKQNPYSEGSD